MADQHDQDEYAGLPITWPFRFAGLCLLIALAYYCAGFATEDVGKDLWGHFEVFRWLLIVGVISVAGGIVFNWINYRRQAH